MKTHDVQSVGIARPFKEVFDYVAEPMNLVEWTNAFARADHQSAELVTPQGNVPIELITRTDSACGTVDWEMRFPDGSIGTAYSRVTPDSDENSIFSFLLMAPPVPLEILEGALAEQMKTLEKELLALKERLEK
ncbi:hypothetical protein J0X12_14735 [Sneathiella sp. CAU 1612]|uniref:SRPBCC family protein n=1 Tax=Sneathiella sedimenti TaxID=2816034 RepID=A0ABS3F8P1_9PROT|nr:hypothetical protein [Sneathiella sedimenti]MBO0334881.1 hypothetical protein [Sneathiella sedimenti]